MAHQVLTSLSAVMWRGLLLALMLPVFAATAEAQRTDPRGPCVTRHLNGKAYLHCRSTSASRRANRARSNAWRRAAPIGSEAMVPPPAVPAPISRNGNPQSPAAANGVARPGRRAPEPVRALIEPAEMPPREVAGYGMVAFTTRPLRHDLERSKSVCEAYKAALLSQDELPAGTPLSDQMITFWPVLDKTAPEAMRADCTHLVQNYALRLGLDAIQDADKKREGFASRRGPFLVAWAPSESRFQPDAVVLVMDLSSLDSLRSFTEVFQDWRQQIVDNPQLWRRGFDIELVRRTIRDTFDRYGEGLMKLIRAGS